MPNVTLTGNALSTGPSSTNYAGAVTGVYGKTAEVLWKEGSYYYVRLMSPKVEGYISTSFAPLPSGTSVRTFTPLSNAVRYVNTSSNAYLGQGTSYEVISQLERGLEAYYLGKRVGSLDYIEYSLSNSPLKYRAWYPYLNLSTVPVYSPGRYVTQNEIDSSGDVWNVTGPWGTSGHLAIDVRRGYGTGALYGNDAMRGTNIYAIADGTVVTSTDNTRTDGGIIENGVGYGGNGKCIVIEHETEAGKLYYSSYCHLNDRYVEVGDNISKNQVIGTMGSTGNVQVVSGARIVHLHLHITDDNAGEGAAGYKDGFTGGTNYTEIYNAWLGKNLRYYNPTQYFLNGESFIDNN